ncbi:pro-epidermal growth factor [Chanos chanos]|uniref:Pro-epidermal growth factor n=1 Tax=Chanos chanos TaxID=29144 RepID=A0A6J2X183_CHACN|nr:pro-epidermal growth factor-like [Chanos chanos]
MNLDGREQRRVVLGVGPSLLLDYHLAEERVYWAEQSTGVISRARLDGTLRQRLLSSGKGISGLAVDWVASAVFWSSLPTGTIHRMDMDGKNQRVFLRHLTQPSNMVIDPNERFLFWLSGGVTQSIQRFDVGSEKGAAVLKVPDRLKALSIDHRDKRLFWLQRSRGKLPALGSCDYNGNVINIISQSLRSQFLKMSVFLDFVYLTDPVSKSIIRLNKYTGRQAENVNSKRMLYPPVDLKVVHSLNQPVTEHILFTAPGCDPQTGKCVNVCSSHRDRGFCHCRDGFTLSKDGQYCEDVNECALWNHGCSLGCENVPGSYFCTCPYGYLLLPDTKTCSEAEPCVDKATLCEHECVRTLGEDLCLCPEGSVLQPDGHSCSGCSSADNGGCSQLCVPLTPGKWECECHPGYQLQSDGKHCTATGPAPYLLFANMVDIRQMTMDGTTSSRLIEVSKGAAMALDYDPVQSRVYFASSTLRQIERAALDGGNREVLLSTELDSPQGLALDWINRRLYWTDRGLSTISCCNLNGLNRKILIQKDVHKPRGIAVHPQAKKLFWTDAGSHPVVERSGLDGEDRLVVVSAGLVSPSGLAVDHSAERLYWCDSGQGLVESARLDGTDRRTLTENQVGHPLGVAVFEDFLWVSDWEGHVIYRLDKRTGHNSERLHADAMQPAGLVIVHPLSKPGADFCLHQNGGCAQVCERELGFAHCSCHSKFIQSADGKGCLPINASFTGNYDDDDDDESSDNLSLKNSTLNDESRPLGVPTLPSDSDQERDDGQTLFTEKMVSDQDDCYSVRCDVNAVCVLKEGSAVCQCLEGFTGNGQLCVDECALDLHSCDVHAECLNMLGQYQCKCTTGYTGSGFSCDIEDKDASSLMSTSSPSDVTSPWQHSNIVVSCPSTHDSYCMYDGVCFYFPEMESYACNCVSGYMGERCQFSDLEWWELQQAEEEKRRNMVIAVCMVLLVALLPVAACVTYCYRSRKFFQKHPNADNMSETSMTEDSTTDTTSAATPQFYVVLERGVCADGKVLHVVGCQRRIVCPSCSSETVLEANCLYFHTYPISNGCITQNSTAESAVSEETTTSPKDNHCFESGVGQANNYANKPGVHLKVTDNLIFLDDPQPPSPELI